MCQARIYCLFLQKISWPVLFSYKLITFSSNWFINLPRETAVDIVLDISENCHSNICIEVLSEVAAHRPGGY